VKEFCLDGDGVVTALIEPFEADIVRDLAGQLTSLLEQPVDGDPALLRLLPDAYPDDEASSSEFRRYTRDSLTKRKVDNARTVIETLDAVAGGERVAAQPSYELRLGRDETIAWLTTLTDIRLTLAHRMGIIADDQVSDDPELQNLYDWLGFVQNAIVETLGG